MVVGSPVSLSASNLPEGATFNSETNTFSWTPTGEQAGTYENVTFQVASGDPELTDSQSITIMVVNVNDAPVLEAIGARGVTATNPLQIQLSATDANDDELTYSFAGDEISGASINAATGLFTWTPTTGQVGSYEISFTVSDGTDSDSETIVITVSAVPVVVPVVSSGGGSSFIPSGSSQGVVLGASTQRFEDGTIVKLIGKNQYYLIMNGQKIRISPYIFKRKYSKRTVVELDKAALKAIPTKKPVKK